MPAATLAPPEIKRPIEAPKAPPPVEPAKPTFTSADLPKVAVSEARSGLEAIGGTHLRTDATSEQLTALRDPTKVGPEQYGKKGLVNSNHTDEMTVAQHEIAQEQAYAGLEQKVKEGVVDPASIGADIVHQLEVSPTIDNPPTSVAEVMPRIQQELTGFVEKGFMTQEEAADVQAEMGKFTALYGKIYADASPVRIYEVSRDNARKLAYQIKMDKHMFSGSDHGNKHLLRGNVRFAEQMIGDLKAQGVAVSDKDELLTRQNMYDHDLGYATGAAQAKKGFEASKDHPLFSTAFIEANKVYYVEKFGEKEYQALRYVVLHHSYPKSEYEGRPAEGSDINVELVRSITSTVDALGVTAETKAAVFFEKPESINVLLKIKLAMETVGVENDKGLKIIDPALMEKYKGELRAIAGQEGSADRQQGFVQSIDRFFNEFTVDATLGQYTGVVDRVGVVRQGDKLVPKVDMHMSRIHALLGDMFGGKIEAQAFVKAMKDFGVSKADMGNLGLTLDLARRKGVKFTEAIKFSSEAAAFEVAPQFAEEAGGEFANVREVIEHAYDLSIRTDVNRLISEFDKNPDQAAENIDVIAEKFVSGVTDKTTEAELATLMGHLSALTDRSPSGTQNAKGEAVSKSQVAQQELRRFLTQREKEFLGVES